MNFLVGKSESPKDQECCSEQGHWEKREERKKLREREKIFKKLNIVLH
jgi:hypothetical protein